MLLDQVETANLLGIRVHKLTRQQFLRILAQLAKAKKKAVIANVNIHAMNLAYKLAWYRDFLDQADLVLCDGFGVALGAKLTGQHIRAEHRLTCPDWLEDLALICEQNQLSLLLLAGKPGIAEAAIKKIKDRCPQSQNARSSRLFSKNRSRK